MSNNNKKQLAYIFTVILICLFSLFTVSCKGNSVTSESTDDTTLNEQDISVFVTKEQAQKVATNAVLQKFGHSSVIGEFDCFSLAGDLKYYLFVVEMETYIYKGISQDTDSEKTHFLTIFVSSTRDRTPVPSIEPELPVFYNSMENFQKEADAYFGGESMFDSYVCPNIFRIEAKYCLESNCILIDTVNHGIANIPEIGSKEGVSTKALIVADPDRASRIENKWRKYLGD